jgi:hypothetical protein
MFLLFTSASTGNGKNGTKLFVFINTNYQCANLLQIQATELIDLLVSFSKFLANPIQNWKFSGGVKRQNNSIIFGM